VDSHVYLVLDHEKEKEGPSLGSWSLEFFETKRRGWRGYPKKKKDRPAGLPTGEEKRVGVMKKSASGKKAPWSFPLSTRDRGRGRRKKEREEGVGSERWHQKKRKRRGGGQGKPDDLAKRLFQ